MASRNFQDTLGFNTPQFLEIWFIIEGSKPYIIAELGNAVEVQYAPGALGGIVSSKADVDYLELFPLLARGRLVFESQMTQITGARVVTPRE